jgi:hypothetical protein
VLGNQALEALDRFLQRATVEQHAKPIDKLWANLHRIGTHSFGSDGLKALRRFN